MPRMWCLPSQLRGATISLHISIRIHSISTGIKFEQYVLRARQVGMRTLQDSQLAVSIYPTFSYDARGGGGVAQVTRDLG